MAGQTYLNGVQLLMGDGSHPVLYIWTINGHFSSLTALVGVDTVACGDSSASSGTMRFVNSEGSPIPFSAGGQTVTHLALTYGQRPTSVVLNLREAEDLVIQFVGMGCVDFTNDRLFYEGTFGS